MTPLVRIEDAGLGADAPVCAVVSRVSDPERLRAAWTPSGAVVTMQGERLRGVSTVAALTRAAGRGLETEEAQELIAALDRAVAGVREGCPGLPLSGLPTVARPLLMGVVNVTPDSFSDGGVLYPDGHPVGAVKFARELLAQGADIIDIGGESTRPGAEPVDAEEELRRVLPVIEALAGEAVISIDTVKADVARAALNAGAQIVNDVSGAADEKLLAEVAQAQAVYVLMHTRGTPVEMQSLANYDNVVAEVYEFLADGLARCVEAGIDESRIVLDPGIGFAKTAAHNFALLAALRQFRGLGRPVLLGASRKSFLATVLDDAPAQQRLEASLACAAHATAAGVGLLRVHDVAETLRVVRTTAAITGWPA